MRAGLPSRQAGPATIWTPFCLSAETIRRSFCSHSLRGDCALIEGNRGLYDGIDLDGTTSTAELAKLLCAPVVMCLDCTKTTRTMAAVISGCVRFDPEVAIRGVILNRVAGCTDPSAPQHQHGGFGDRRGPQINREISRAPWNRAP
jgi:cobyrinic acid a,c-diamide synthase